MNDAPRPAVLDVVSRIYACLAEGDVASAVALAAEDCVFDGSRRAFDPVVLQGRSGLEGYAALLDEVWKDTRLEPALPGERVGDDGLLVAVRLRTLGRASRIEVSARAAHLWRVGPDRLLRRWTVFQSLGDARAELAAGTADRPV